MISTVIFDVGGVLIRTEDRRPRQELEQQLGLSPGQAELLVFNSDMGRAAQLGEISSAELWEWVRQQLQLDEAGLRHFQSQFWAGDRLNTELLALVRALRPRYRTAIISNFMDDLPRLMTEVYPMADAFEEVVISAAEGVMKPDPEIFERALRRLDCAAAETVFIDDFPHNLAGARAVGIRTIHYTPTTDVRAELAQVGVIVEGNVSAQKDLIGFSNL
jgi:putative hydrolase of the HAD superfamily